MCQNNWWTPRRRRRCTRWGDHENATAWCKFANVLMRPVASNGWSRRFRRRLVTAANGAFRPITRRVRRHKSDGNRRASDDRCDRIGRRSRENSPDPKGPDSNAEATQKGGLEAGHKSVSDRNGGRAVLWCGAAVLRCCFGWPTDTPGLIS